MADAIATASAEQSTSGGWFFVGPNAQPVGPYDHSGLQALLQGNYITRDTPAWREGLAEWKPVHQIAELKHLLPTQRPVIAVAPVKKTTGDPLLDKFKAEIEGVEQEAAPETGADAPGTPEELEFEDDDGTMYIWDHKLRKYVAKAVADGAEAPAGVAVPYNEADMVFQADEEVVPTLQAALAADAEALAAEEGKHQQDDDRKRASEAAGTSGTEPANGHPPGKRAKKGQGQQQEQQPQAWFDLKNNTSVYVTGLPDDVTVEEVAGVFTKCGVLKLDEKMQPRVKLYRDKASGLLKGDALVTYLKQPSVDLAVQILDGVPFRDGMGSKMTVALAKFEMKGEAYVPRQRLSKKEKKALLEKQEKRLLGWGGFDDKVLPEKVTVILKNMFTPQEFEEDLLGPEELESDVKAECSKCGPVDVVKVYKAHPQGVVSVKFKTEEGAHACIQLMNGRWFGGRQLQAALWDGVANYAVKVKESAEEQEARLEAFSKELEGKA